ncbi:hypothetical protein [uncultured Nostoc sp.]|uniref:hypothetical protein n=1 Tax=uncultured Nostoc sp. TaxID=340711 RepID=UPI0035CB5BAC
MNFSVTQQTSENVGFRSSTQPTILLNPSVLSSEAQVPSSEANNENKIHLDSATPTPVQTRLIASPNSCTDAINRVS